MFASFLFCDVCCNYRDGCCKCFLNFFFENASQTGRVRALGSVLLFPVVKKLLNAEWLQNNFHKLRIAPWPFAVPV